MDSGFYAACAGLVARSQALDLAASNLANANTTAFRAEQPRFHSLIAQSHQPSTMLAAAVNDFGVIGGTYVDHSQGSFQKTGNPFDLALEGPGFLAVETASGIRYTRNGAMQLSADNHLVTDAGDAVLGEDGRPLTLPSGAISISGDGTISVDGALAGKIQVVEFPEDTAISKAGSSYYAAPTAAARKSSGTTLRQGMLESSNLNPIAASVGLIALQRHAESLQRALSTFHSEFNRMAAEDLPKV